MNETPGMFVFGASGHAKVVIDAIEKSATRSIILVCDDAQDKRGTTFMGYIVGNREDLLARRRDAAVGIVSIGDNAARMRVAGWLLEQGYTCIPVVHPSAVLGRGVEVGSGTVVMAGCVINSGARLGSNVILNTGATIDHDCRVEDGAHIAPGSHLCGGVSVGAGALIGAGTTIIPGVRVGSGALIGAGSTVLSDVPDRVRAAGNPCRVLA